VKLLRFLQEKCFQRVGVAGGKFREDLYFRLAVVVVKVPPRRERGDDIVLVAKAFLHNYAVEHAKPGLTFAPDALRALGVHLWPGNVRELQNRVQRAVIMADGKRVTARDLELNDTLSALPPQTLKEARERDAAARPTTATPPLRGRRPGASRILTSPCCPRLKQTEADGTVDFPQ
jgi:two-component system NtrC family response regulator